MSESDVQRLVQRVRLKPDGRAAVKLRTVLSAFGYSRRTSEVVRQVQQQLAAQGVSVDFSVSSPANLDERIVLALASTPRNDLVPPATESSRELAKISAVHTSEISTAEILRTPASQETVQPVPDPSGHAERLPDALKPDAKVANSVEPPRSLAARLLRTARGLFRTDPPTTLGIHQSADATWSRLPGATILPAEPLSRPPPNAVTRHPELSYVAEQTIRATVLIEVQNGFGSGFLVHPDGLVITACHVLDGPDGVAKKATVRLQDGRESTASLIRAHRALDFALLWLDTPGQYPVLVVGDARKTRYAETVLAVGHPGISDASGQIRALRNTVSTGVVANPACKERGIEWIQMTTDIDPGNSGGPLVNGFGEVIGVNCWKFTSVAAAKMALPLDYLNEDLATVIERGREAYTKGRVCSICGWFEISPVDWFCPTCGTDYPSETKAA